MYACTGWHAHRCLEIGQAELFLILVLDAVATAFLLADSGQAAVFKVGILDRVTPRRLLFGGCQAMIFEIQVLY